MFRLSRYVYRPDCERAGCGFNLIRIILRILLILCYRKTRSEVKTSSSAIQCLRSVVKASRCIPHVASDLIKLDTLFSLPPHPASTPLSVEFLRGAYLVGKLNAAPCLVTRAKKIKYKIFHFFE